MRWTFGEFELDQAGRRLARAGLDVPLEPKAFDMLCYLAAHAGRVIGKDELLERVWDAKVLSDNVLSNTVAKLRKALNQGARSSQPIETLHGRGYRFHADVQVLRVSAQAPRDPFVGRAGVMQALSATLTQVDQGRCQVVLLAGEPGIGKSRVLHELTHIAAARGFSCWIGSAYPDGAAPVYWPWVEILRAAHASAAAAFRSCVPQDAWALSLLVPELLGHKPEAAGSDAHALRFRLFDELTRLLSAAASAAPRLIAIEDLHWADAGSIELLAHVARGLSAQPVLLIATLQEHAAGSDSTQRAALARLSRVAARFELEGLSQEAVVALLQELCADRPPAPGCAELLHARTQGNPLFIQQLVQLLQQRGLRLEPQLLMAAELPPAIRDVAAQRLAGLPSGAYTLLAAAAVIGPQFDAALLAQLTAATTDRVISELDPALRFGLVRLITGVPHRFGFTHAIWRECLYESLRLIERGGLHLRLMQLMAADTVSADARRLAEIAHHSLHALPSQLEACAAHCQRAAEAAREASSFESAAELQRRALAKLAAEGGDARWRAELLAQLGLNLFCAGDLSGGFRSLEDSARLAQTIGAPELLAYAAIRLTDWLLVGGDHQQVRALVETSLSALAPGSADEMRAVLLARLAELSVERSREERAELYAQAQALCEHLPARSRFEVALARVSLRDPRCLQDSQLAANSCRRLLREHAGELSGMRVRLGVCSVAMTEYACALTAADIVAADRAFAQLQRSVQAAHVQPLSHGLEIVAAGRALAEDRQADLSGCIERLSSHASLAGGLGMGALYYSAQAMDARGELVLDMLTGFAGQSELVRDFTPAQLLAAMSWIASAAARAGGHALARQVLGLIPVAELARLPLRWGDLGVLCHVASAAAELAERELIERLYAQLAPFAALNAVGAAFDYLGSVEHFLGQLALALEQRERACDHLQRAAATNAALRMPKQLQRTQALLLRAHG